MTTIDRRVTRLDGRNRVVLPDADNAREYAIDSLPGGAFLVTPCTTTVETDFERWLKERVPNIDLPDSEFAEGQPTWAEINREAQQEHGTGN